MSNVINVSEDTLIIKQENETWFINKKDDGIEAKCEFLTTEGYEEGFVLKFNSDETIALTNFLNKLTDKAGEE